MSVIIPAVRFDPYVDEAVESVFAQSHCDYEVIVVNDGSTNRSGLERFRERFAGRVTVLDRENGGPAAARNSGIRAALAPVVAFLDEDDLWEPTFLAEQLAFLSRVPEADVVYADARLFGDSPAAGRLVMELFASEGQPTLENLLARRCNVVMSAVVARRAALERVGLFDEARRYAEDYDLWLRLAHAGGRIAYQRQVLLRRRIHRDNLTRDNERLGAALIGVLEDFSDRRRLTDGERRALDDTLHAARSEVALERCKASLSRGDLAAARRASADVDRKRLSWKGRLAMQGLDTVPRLVALIYRARERASTRSRRHGQADGHAPAPRLTPEPVPGAAAPPPK